MERQGTDFKWPTVYLTDVALAGRLGLQGSWSYPGTMMKTTSVFCAEQVVRDVPIPKSGCATCLS